MTEEISIKWYRDDIIFQAKANNIKLNDEEASYILERIKDSHDCNIGVNWDVIDSHIREYDMTR